ncbi:MAG: rsmB [Gammaproteobacteria bacterium]|jgi:16S rRNA (cytosine967-C5)-methyltransferase|nr:rsmB [Gammaproteobacteria bacterium]
MKAVNLQARAANVLCDVILEGYSLDDALNHALKKNSAQKGLLQELCYGTLRHYERLVYILDQLLQKPLKKGDGDIEIILLLGLYQLQEMHMPEAVSVAETVNAVQKTWAKGLVNAVLRNFLRAKTTLIAEENMPENALYAHPQWMIDLWQIAFPQHWQAICTANNERPPMALRINLARIEKKAYLALLRENNIAYHDVPTIPSAVILEKAMSVESLPGFNEGKVSVQDSGAQILISLLDLKPDLNILDACSAPGGKLLHLLESADPSVKVTAVEIDPNRLLKIKDNLQRLHYKNRAKLITADILDTKAWSQGELYDRIIADVPCSATGVIRRHPDIKLLRQEEDIDEFAATQYEILETLWLALKTRGILIYITCSICPQENEELVQQFLAYNPDAHCLPINAQQGLALTYGYQFLPGLYPGDGFYYAKLQKLDE